MYYRYYSYPGNTRLCDVMHGHCNNNMNPFPFCIVAVTQNQLNNDDISHKINHTDQLESYNSTVVMMMM